MEGIRLLWGQCLFSWLENAFFLTFWHNPNGPIKIHLAFPPGSICQLTVSFGEWKAGFKFRTAENRLSIGAGSCVSCFYFQKYPILLQSVELQLDGGPLGQQEDGSASEFRVIPGRVFQGGWGISLIRNLLEQNIPTVLFLEIPI